MPEIDWGKALEQREWYADAGEGVFEDVIDRVLGDRIRSDIDFAQRVYWGLCNTYWIGPGEVRWSDSFRGAGDLISDIYGQGSDYCWFYFGVSDGPAQHGLVDDEVKEILAKEGWSPVHRE